MLPELHIVETKRLIAHETVDPVRIHGLVAQFSKGEVFKNPPLVAPFEQGKYVVLDGANRVAASTKLKFPHLPVQVVDYKDLSIELFNWNHVIEGVAWQRWWDRVMRIGDDVAVSMPLTRARMLLKKKKLCAYIISRAEHCYGIHAPRTKKHFLQLWNKFVETYKGKFNLHRTIDSDTHTIRARYPNYTGLVVFPPLKKRDILHFARNGLKIPSGISRHVIPGRALHVDIPFSFLRSDKNVKRKNQWLTQHIAQLNQNNCIRYYSEPVYLYDE